jgi:glycerate 2-kinase
MPLKVLIVPDKFKGTLSAAAAAEAIARGWRRARPQDELRRLPMSDGGDGFGEVIGRILEAREEVVEAVDAAHRPCRVAAWWAPDTQTAIVESARVVGLAMLPPGQFHPFDLDTMGLAGVLRALAAKGVRRCVIGIGGSATNDAGFGLARALGWKFLAADDREITRWTGLHRLERLVVPRRRWGFEEVRVAVDVRNRLLGPKGASKVYGPQKGLRPEDFPKAERCLRQLAKVVREQTGTNWAAKAGSGAAGGLGFGLGAFLGGRLEPGFALFARLAGLTDSLLWADLVVTGEGRLDESTLMGKGVGQVAERCRQLHRPCFGLAGAIQPQAGLRRAFADARALLELASPPQAMARPAFWLARLAAEVAACACARPG